ncbi:hypothetical protein BAUCODRAFT_333200 [Baudoinia panamericana UAMH 10762]|uniref:Uncharacterized protein n=1 Tax=Baudoinia panamericana (strain UAMH 10762) TaxID=717646 RepID=M2LB32_BAUPA|nr:uncharacterized protein BAUCODRAFT_333200 [Baudoinia panamericana UAMH 10762]EMC91017.1 hypothetical protein BAUCODRAFT_333200 [Baudoinia panamericana UAMH 10762]
MLGPMIWQQGLLTSCFGGRPCYDGLAPLGLLRHAFDRARSVPHHSPRTLRLQPRNSALLGYGQFIHQIRSQRRWNYDNLNTS